MATRILRALTGGTALLLWVGLSACGSSSDSSQPVATTPGPGSITGTVAGTRIVAIDSNDQIVAEDDTTGRPRDAQGHVPYQLSGLQLGTPLRIFFITGGRIYPLYIGNPETNVFSLTQAGAIDLGFVATSAAPPEKATPEHVSPPSSYNPGQPNTTLPASIAPTMTVTSPAQNDALPAGPVTVNFVVQNFSWAGRGNRICSLIWIAIRLRTIS